MDVDTQAVTPAAEEPRCYPLCLVDILSPEDLEIVREYIPDGRPPDLVIAPDGSPYLYRWYLVPRTKRGNVYLHVQVQSDPERPLHDHPWDNQSVVLIGGYDEVIQKIVPNGPVWVEKLRAGQVKHRRAEWAHRLVLPEGVPYTVTLFATGPVVRDWGFQLTDKHGQPTWRPHTDCIIWGEDGRSIFKNPLEAQP